MSFPAIRISKGDLTALVQEDPYRAWGYTIWQFASSMGPDYVGCLPLGEGEDGVVLGGASDRDWTREDAYERAKSDLDSRAASAGPANQRVANDPDIHPARALLPACMAQPAPALSEEPMSKACPECSTMDWSEVDQTLGHHPECGKVLVAPQPETTHFSTCLSENKYPMPDTTRDEALVSGKRLFDLEQAERDMKEYRNRLDAVSYALPYWMGFTGREDWLSLLVIWINAHRFPYSYEAIEESWRYNAQRANELEAENLKLKARWGLVDDGDRILALAEQAEQISAENLKLKEQIRELEGRIALVIL